MRVPSAPRLVALLALLAAAAPAPASASSPTVARALHARVERSRVFRLPGRPSHVALHWRGERSARVRVALGPRGPLRAVRPHQLAVGHRTPQPLGSLVRAPRARTG